MSEICAYLIPRKNFKVGQFLIELKSVLEDLQLVNGFYEQENNWFAAGEKAHLLFEDNNGFEYLEVHDTMNKRLIPEGLHEIVECSYCKNDVREDVNELIFDISEKEYEENIETDLSMVEFVCPNCSQTSNLTSLKYNEVYAFVNQYICLVDILGNINLVQLNELEKHMDTSFQVIYGSI